MQLNIILKFAILFTLLTSSIAGSNTMRSPEENVDNVIPFIAIGGPSNCPANPI
ncbi:hypothetical protein DAPPUDRAFT_233845 [Daphnia pulex]|uniref:Uncharacterized protein n=1 Tax=Daphnia pulex TaxID=6669 RepID=E9FVX0_DAPPU|nr:hypothetical protein DAPPUDRAFT_233845 [Daphnia pulex]|eukprot:EFX88625.1 hypothetical protein DAPPUDRAFT_233845 [Daphnia pulex]